MDRTDGERESSEEDNDRLDGDNDLYEDISLMYEKKNSFTHVSRIFSIYHCTGSCTLELVVFELLNPNVY